MFLRNICLPRGFLYDEDDSGDGAGNGGGKDRLFSQDDVNRLLAQNKRELRAELETLRGSLDEERSARQELEQNLIDVVGGEEEVERYMQDPEGYTHGDDDGDDDGDFDAEERFASDSPIFIEQNGELVPVAGADNIQALVSGIQRRANQKVEALDKRLNQEIEKREALEKQRLESERDQQLTTALIKNDVVDVSAGLKLFKENMEYDPEDGWRYKTKDGLFVDASAGLAEELPDYMRKALGGSGGAGSKGSSSSALQTQLTRKQQEVADAEAKAKGSGDTRDIARWQVLQRELRGIQAQSSPPSHRAATADLQQRYRQPVNPSNPQQ